MNNKQLVANRLIFDKEKMRVLIIPSSTTNYLYRSMNCINLVYAVLRVCSILKPPSSINISQVALMLKPNN